MSQPKDPAVSRELVEHLETKVFPERAPDAGDSYAECMVAAGKAEVVRYLRRLHNSQVERALGTTGG